MITHLTEEDIKKINDSKDFDSWYQGIYKEAYGVPNDMKEMSVYKRWKKSGADGGSCWGTDAEYYEGDPEPDFVALDKALAIIAPTLTHLHYREIERAVISSDTTDYHYYGNYDDWGICFIPLPTIYAILEKLGY